MSGPYRSPSKPSGADAVEPDAPTSIDLGAVRSTHAWPPGQLLIALAAGGWTEVVVHERGLMLSGTEVRTRTRIPFEEIDAIHYDCRIPGRPSVVLVTFEGKRVAIPAFLDALDQFLEALDRGVTWPIMKSAREALAAGEPLTFGPVVLALDGLVVDGQELSWKLLDHVVAEHDSIVFYAGTPFDGRFGWVKLVDVPHPRVLFDVLRLRTRVVIDGLRLRASE